jgi:hypothetical protein
MALLLFSNKCQHSKNVLEFLNKNSSVKSVVQLYDVSIHGVPQQLSGQIHSVPTLVTKSGEIKIGKEVIAWLQSLIPPPEITQCQLGGGGCCGMASFGTEATEDNFFNLDDYGQSLQPTMTTDLESKISRNVTDAFTNGP